LISVSAWEKIRGKWGLGFLDRILYTLSFKDMKKKIGEAGGAAMNAIIKTEVAVNKVGINKTPNHPM
jgi:hypothetical protein